MLSRKYYRLIAKAISKSGTTDESGWDRRLLDKNELINNLCMKFEKDNSLFNRDRFVDACD